MKKALKRVLLIGGGLYLGVLILLTLLETTLMYPAPNPAEGDWNPTWLDYEEVLIQTDVGNTIHGWFCEHPTPRAVVLLCHGNGEQVAFMAEELAFLRDRFEVSVFAFDYRGYGKSPGKPFEAGVLQDGLAAQNWLAERTKVPAESIVLWGRSLGGAVAVHLASRQGARGLILDRTFSSMVDVASSHYPWLPVRWLLSNRYPSDKRIQKYSGPLLQIHGQADRIVPIRFGQALFDACPSSDKVLLTSKDLGHNSSWPPEFYQALDAFLQRL